MPENLPTPELRLSLDKFIQYREEHLIGDEKGEAQVFLVFRVRSSLTLGQ